MPPLISLAATLTAALLVTASASVAQDAAPDPAPVEPAPGEEAAAGMTPARLGEIIAALDPEPTVLPNGYAFTIAERELILVYDDQAGRMRIITPVAPAGLADEGLMRRMLQANFDAVLDVRYAIANDMIWAAFMHPLPTLAPGDLVSAIAQTVTAAETFGTTFSSGALVFGGGDSNALHQRLIEELEEALTGDEI